MEAKIIDRSGNGISGRITFQAHSSERITEEQASSAQMKAGYHPAGYDFFSFRCIEKPDGTYLASWQCSASCD